jgi:hypothetical protein
MPVFGKVRVEPATDRAMQHYEHTTGLASPLVYQNYKNIYSARKLDPVTQLLLHNVGDPS